MTRSRDEAGMARPAASTGLTNALTGATLAALGAAGPALTADLKISPAMLSMVFAAQTVGMLLGAATAGAMRNRAPTIRAVALLTIAALAGVAAAPSFAFLALALGIAGAGCYALNTSAQATVMGAVRAVRAAALSRFHVLGALGGVAFPLTVAPLLGLGMSWRWGFLVVAMGYCVVARSPRRLFVREPPLAPPRGHVSARARWVAGIVFLGVGIQVSVPLHLGNLAVDRFEASPAVASLAVGAFWFGLLLARVAGTAALPRVSEANQLWASCVSLAGGYAVLAVAHGVTSLTCAAILMGAGVGQLLPLGAARAADEIGDDAYSSSLTFVLAATAQLVIPIAVASVLAFVSLYAAILATSVFAVIIPLAVAYSRPPG